MYDYIVKNLDVLEYDLKEGKVVTPKGTNGTRCNSTGYLRVKVRGKLLQVHQVLAVIYFGDKCLGKQVNHIDGNKTNNVKGNLEMVSRTENIKHAWESGLNANTGKNSPRGVDNVSSKLSTEDVIYIRENKHLTSIELAKKFDMSSSTIRRARRGDTYKNVK